MKEIIAFLIGIGFFATIALVAHYVPYGDIAVLVISFCAMAWALGSMFMAAWTMRKLS